MANYFQLISKETGEAEKFSEIDEKMCAHFEQPCDPEKYLGMWYDIIGFACACGRKLDEIMVDQEYSETTRIMAAWLNEHYTTEAWASRG